MHLTPSDPDIATLYRKIQNNRLDLQPNFQRGEVWGKAKKQRLIDSILRGWHIPPVHVIQIRDSEKQEVLDGQQRLAAIRDFRNGEFPVNGTIEPTEDNILKLDGLYWSDLPKNIRGMIEDFTLRVITISDYNPGEPGELFYRLNQPTNLTSAEARNAYFGEARQQVKELADVMKDLGFKTEFLGFSNSRMAYDDVIAKSLLTIEQSTFSKKITGNSVTARYRESTGFECTTTNDVRGAIDSIFSCISTRENRTRLNKATFYSWLIFLYKAKSIFNITQDVLNDYFTYFEDLRTFEDNSIPPKMIPKGVTGNFIKSLINIYSDRAGSRVADISSVRLRDFILWSLFATKFYGATENSKLLKRINLGAYELSRLDGKNIEDSNLLDIIGEMSWGEDLCQV